MTDRSGVEAREADFGVRLARRMTSIGFGLTQLFRRPPSPPGEVRTHRYGEDPAEHLERIAPRAGMPQRAPIVYVHGGGWIAGKKEFYTRYLSFLAEAGYPIFNLEYPLAPEHPHPHMLRSLLGALDWIRTSDADADAEIEGCHFMGDSAGGNLAMMLGLLVANPSLLDAIAPERHGVVPMGCHGVVSLYGVLDRRSWIEDGFGGAEMMLASYAGSDALAPEVGPERAVTPMDLAFETAPPTFLAVGTRDALRRSSSLFAERLAAGPNRVVHKEYPGEGHGFFNLGRSRSDAALRDDILEFLEAQDPFVEGRRD